MNELSRQQEHVSKRQNALSLHHVQAASAQGGVMTGRRQLRVRAARLGLSAKQSTCK